MKHTQFLVCMVLSSIYGIALGYVVGQMYERFILSWAIILVGSALAYFIPDLVGKIL